MTLDEKKNALETRATGSKVNGRIMAAITARRKGSSLSCAEAFDIARSLDVERRDVGSTLDSMKIKIVKCQLGLFGHKEGKRVKPDSSPPEALSSVLTPFRKTGRISCSRVQEIARELNLGRPAVVNACEAFGIKITPCQLGAF